MGQFSILYSITTNSPSRKAVASSFGLREPVLAAWLHTLVYVVLGAIAYLLNTITPHHRFRQRVKDLVVKYPGTDIAAMGFPQNWRSDPFWG